MRTHYREMSRPLFYKSSRSSRYWRLGFISVLIIMLGILLTACGGSGGNTSPDVSVSSGFDDQVTTSAPVTFTAAAPARFAEVSPDANTQGTAGSTDPIFYDFLDIVVSDGSDPSGSGSGGQTYSADIDGWIRYPNTTPPADGWPVVLYLHGRHSTCEYAGGFEFLSSGECPETDNTGAPLTVTSPVNSYQGYDYMAENLTTHGYVVISGNANDVNDKDLVGDRGAQARAQIILHTLDMFRDINAGNRTTDDGDPSDGNVTINDFSALVGAMDFTKVGLMGHSRGGQGVTHTIDFNSGANPNSDRTASGLKAPHNITAVFSLAPTDFDEITATDTIFATLLPYCDGDVSNLQGARTFDNTRYVTEQVSGTLFQVLTMGTNHNYYNTIWIDDDYSDDLEYCSENVASSGRDTPEEQRRHGEFLMSSFFRLFLGEETEFLPYWQGQAQLPASACPLDDNDVAEFPCDEHVKLSIIVSPEQRLVVEDFVDDTALTVNDLGGTTTFTGFSETVHCRPSTGGAGCPSGPTYSRAGQVGVSWDASGAIYSTEFTAQDVTSMDAFTMRAGVNEAERNAAGQNFTLQFTDEHGQVSAVDPSEYTDALFYPPGDIDNSEGKKLTQNSILIPLQAITGIDLNKLVKIEIVFDQTNSGDVQFTDIMFQQIAGSF